MVYCFFRAFGYKYLKLKRKHLVIKKIKKIENKKEECHLSVESFHSVGLFLAGRKRSKLQQMIIGSKKFKKQTQETCSKSYVKPDSSFMNLISNMIKGCSQSTQDEEKSLALNLENPNHHLQQPDQKLLKCNKNKYLELKNAGFRSNF